MEGEKEKMTYGFAWLKQIEDEKLRAKLKKMAKELEEHGFKTETEKELEQSLTEEEIRSEHLQIKTDALTAFLETLAKLDKEDIDKFQTLLKEVEFRRQVAQHLLGSLIKINTKEIQQALIDYVKANVQLVANPDGSFELWDKKTKTVFAKMTQPKLKKSRAK